MSLLAGVLGTATAAVMYACGYPFWLSWLEALLVGAFIGWFWAVRR